MFSQESSAAILGLESGDNPPDSDYTSDDPLHDACYAGNKDEVKRLLDQGYDVNLRDATKATPLHYAASGGHVEIVNMLLDRGADIHAQGHQDFTALHLAYFNGHFKAISCLLTHGADPLIISTLEAMAEPDDGDGLPIGMEESGCH